MRALGVREVGHLACPLICSVLPVCCTAMTRYLVVMLTVTVMRYVDGMRGIPEWVASQLAARGICECCGSLPAATVWAGTGQRICWECVDRKREAGMG